MANGEAPDSIGEALDRSDRLIEGLERTIRTCRKSGIPNPHVTYPNLFEVIIGVLKQQRSLLVLLDKRITELDQRLEDA